MCCNSGCRFLCVDPMTQYPKFKIWCKNPSGRPIKIWCQLVPKNLGYLGSPRNCIPLHLPVRGDGATGGLATLDRTDLASLYLRRCRRRSSSLHAAACPGAGKCQRLPPARFVLLKTLLSRLVPQEPGSARRKNNHAEALSFVLTTARNLRFRFQSHLLSTAPAHPAPRKIAGIQQPLAGA